MKTSKTTPSEPTGPRLTRELYDQSKAIWVEEGGEIATILRERFGVTDFNPYQHYYGFNIPID